MLNISFLRKAIKNHLFTIELDRVFHNYFYNEFHKHEYLINGNVSIYNIYDIKKHYEPVPDLVKFSSGYIASTALSNCFQKCYVKLIT